MKKRFGYGFADRTFEADVKHHRKRGRSDETIAIMTKRTLSQVQAVK
jgi:hypothetical protein